MYDFTERAYGRNRKDAYGQTADLLHCVERCPIAVTDNAVHTECGLRSI